MIVCFTGLKGSGKDTAAAYLVRHHGFVQFAFADALYAEVAHAFGVPEEKLRCRGWKNEPQTELALRNCNQLHFTRRIIQAQMPPGQAGRAYAAYCSEAQTCPRTSTFLLQQWADVRRAIHGNDYYTDKLILKMTMQPSDRIVVSDVREDSWAEALESYSALLGVKCGIAKIEMEGTRHTGHSSDDGLSPQYISTIIVNQPGKLANLYQQLDQFIAKGITWTPHK